jgi:TonB family protein
MRSWFQNSGLETFQQPQLSAEEGERILKQIVLEIEAQTKEKIQQKKRRRWEMALFLVLALLLHLPLLYVIDHYALSASRPLPSGAKKLRVHMVPRGASSKKLANRIPKKAEEKKENLPDKQLVSTATPLNSERPDKAEFLAEHNEKVDQQTKSTVSAPSERVSARPQTGAHKAKTHDEVTMPEQRAGASGVAQAKVQPSSHEEMKAAKTGTKSPRVLAKRLVNTSESRPNQGESNDVNKGGKNKMNLVPSWRELEQYAGMPFNDHLENIEEDAETRLNTFEYKHAVFFNRIKENVARAWDPIKQVRRFDPNGALFGRRDRVTVVEISIDKQGNVVMAKVKKPSGVFYLDEEALRAFRAAGPFPNPPKVIFGQNESFSFPFSFYISNDKGSSIDFNWKPY